MICNFSDTRLDENRIPDVEFKELKSFPDERGFFRELVRITDPFFTDPSLGSGNEKACFAQWSHSKMGKDTVKAWHFHHQQIDWWYVPIGVCHVALIDNREESPTFKRKIEFKLGDPEEDREALTAVLRIPQGVLHGCRVLSDTAHLFYITSRTYDPNDEGRFPFNAGPVPHDWGAGAITVPNDRRMFMPTKPRAV